MTLPGLVRANNLNDVVDRERAWDNLGSSLATGDIAIPAPSLDLNFAANKSLVDDISGNNLITFIPCGFSCGRMPNVQKCKADFVPEQVGACAKGT